jgi:lysophospholipase L1-like esterase
VFGVIVASDLTRAEPRLRDALMPKRVSLPPYRAPAGVKKIVLVGDSTVATGGGWGPGFCALMPRDVQCVDLALNGRSSISYINEGSWAKALAEHGDVYFIQFGHNDEKPGPTRHTDPDTTFAATLTRMIADVKAQGGHVVLLSPLARRTFVDGRPSNPDLRKYGDAAARVAREQGEQYIDLLSLSEAYLAKGTQADADAFDADAHPDAKAENAGKAEPKLDRTHLNESGKQVFGAMVAEAYAQLPR